ncbi:universal stress protein [Yinghuangia seranimata]|uniref:universal stress protein n=1 Tax=Yinghuangia seranimata TaxID=408067 RepID=UPI00248BEAF1|nr:universal stress protein [Yinghuangia seranimata]MDI2129516.1 universal stress protein [Yinghuangia seranimata]
MAGYSATAPIVVGVEDSEAGRLAVEWAADEAALRERSLLLVRALDWPPGANPEPADDRPWETWSGRFRTAGQQALDTARAQALARRPELTVAAQLYDGTPEQVLRSVSAEASVVVLGSRRLSSLREALTTGSIAVPVIAHAACPVVVVRHPAHDASVPPTVVVGVDGSPESEQALAYAFEEAAPRGAGVLALWACQLPMMPVAGMAADALAQDARDTMDHMLADVVGKYPDVPVRRQIGFDHPVRMLADASKTALAVVVGTRGLGGFRGMLLGSVSHGLVHHAQCPLIVVPRSAEGD